MTCSAYQFDDSSALVGDPVDVISGASLERTLDFQLTGPIRMLWIRHYDSSQNRRHYSLGWGHSHDYDRWLSFDVDGMRYTGILGHAVGFPPLINDGQRFARAGVVLHRVTPTLYRVHQYAEPSMEFEFRGRSVAPLSRWLRGRSSIRLFYDEKDRLRGITDSLHRKIRVTTDDAGHILSLTQEGPSGETIRPLLSYRYDEAGNLVWGEDPYHNSFHFKYDANNRIVARSDRRGYSFLFEYDTQGRCTRSTGEDGLHDTRLQYHALEKVTVVTRANGGQWTYLYPTGKLTRIIDPYGGSRELKRDESGRIIEEIDPNENVTRRVYGPTGALAGKISPLNQRLPASDASHKLGPNERILPTGPIEWEYGNVYRRLRPGEAISLPRSYDACLRELPDRVKQQIRTCDPASRDAGVSPPLPPGRRLYDDFGNLVKEGGPNGTSRRWLYDGNGNILRITDRDNSQYVYKYASWDLRTAAINPLENALAFQYTRTQKLSALKDRGGSISHYEHDLKDRLVRIRRHGVVKEQYRYDNADNLIEKLDGKGQPLLSIEIGPGNLRKSKRLASGQTHTYEYDENGRLLKAATDASEVLLDYDRFGNRIKDERDGLGVTHRFVRRNDLLETIYFKRYAVAYRQLGKGKLSIADPRGVTHSVEALGSGLVLRRLGCGSSEMAQFDESGRCLLRATLRRRADLWLRKYSYSGEGDLLAVEDNVRGTVRYRCDAAHRLIGAELPGERMQRFEYDAAGNLLRQPGLDSLVLEDGNRLRLANGDRFEYNDRNHIASRAGNSGESHYVYDSLDMLISAETPKLYWEAEYDALRRRISKTVGERKTEFYWDKERLMAELRADGSVRINIYADDVAMTPFMFLEYDSLKAAPASGKAFYIHGDYHGTPLMVEDDAGRTVWSARIDPYGFAHVDPTSTVEMWLRFPGHYADPEIGLHCNGCRYYSPELGRYLQSDPIGIGGGPNLYAYAEGNPLKYVDLLGTCANAVDEENEEDQEEETLWEAQARGAKLDEDDEEQDTSRGPMVSDELDEDEMTRRRIEAILEVMTDGEKSRTTYAVATVKLADGSTQVQIASAGEEGAVPNRVLLACQNANNDDEPPTVINNKVPGANNRENDAEQTIGRDARENGSQVQSMGATRDMCPACQDAADEDGYHDHVVTPME